MTNEYKSWYENQIKKSIKHHVHSYKLQEGDLIIVEYAGPTTSRRYKGIFKMLTGESILIKQRKREVWFELMFINSLEIIKQANSEELMNNLRQMIDLALDTNDIKWFYKLQKQLNKCSGSDLS